MSNSFTTGVDLNAGTLIVNNASALGSGPLAIANGAALMSGTAILTLANPVTVAGGFTFGTSSPALGTANAVNGVILEQYGDPRRGPTRSPSTAS